MNNPKEADMAVRERVLDWAASYVGDKDWFMQKVVAWWIRDLSKHDAARAQGFLNEHGPYMKSWSRKEAAKYLAGSVDAGDMEPGAEETDADTAAEAVKGLALPDQSLPDQSLPDQSA
jgi:DNA alkylation repair enzyme